MRKNKKKMNKHLLYISFLLVSTTVMAQNNWSDDGSGEIDDAQIVVEKNRKITLPKAVRSFEKIDHTPEIKVTQKVTYNVTPIETDIPTLKPRLRAMTIKPDLLKKLYGNYVKAGFGNFSTPLLNVYLNNKRSKEYDYGVRINHLSSASGPTNNSGTSRTKASVFGDYFLKAGSLGAKLNYDRHGYRYYGYNNDIEVDGDSIKQELNRVGLLGKFNLGEGKDFSADGTVNFNYMSSKVNFSDVNFGYNAKTKYSLSGNSEVGLASMLSIESMAIADTTISRSYIMFTPYYSFVNDRFTTTIGLNLTSHNDQLNNSDRLHVYPNVLVEYELLKDKFTAYGGLRGEIQRNTLSSIMDENPYIDTFAIFDNNKAMEIHGGLKGKLSNELAFSTGIGIANYRNLHFYMNSAWDTSRFLLASETGTIQALHFFAELEYNKNDRTKASAGIKYNGYNMDDLDKPFHRPNFIFNLAASQNFANKFIAKTSLNYVAGLYAYDWNSATSIKLNDIVDINLEFDYKFSDKFSTFVMINNVVSNNYQLYRNYPVRGLNIIGGITYAF